MGRRSSASCLRKGIAGGSKGISSANFKKRIKQCLPPGTRGPEGGEGKDLL